MALAATSDAFEKVHDHQHSLIQLAAAERRDDHLAGARLAARMAERLSEGGGYRAAAHWFDWSLRLYDRLYTAETMDVPYACWRVWHQWVLIKLLLGEDAGLESRLVPRRHNPSGLSWWVWQSGVLHLLLYREQLGDAERLGQHLWQSATRRDHLVLLVNPYVRLLLVQGSAREAQAVAEQVSCLTTGCGHAARTSVRLALALALGVAEPLRSRHILTSIHEVMPAPWRVQAGLLLAGVEERLGHPEAADRLLSALAPHLKEASPSGLSSLLGELLPAGLRGLDADGEAALELRCLGQCEARLRGRVQEVRPRFAELLTVLASYPKGMSAEQLTLAVYGENHDPASCKTEVSRLRQLVPIESRPYRLGVSVWADFLEVPELLSAGRVSEAVALYQGPLLPTSDAPEVRAMRDTLDAALLAGATAAASVEPLWRLSSRMRGDLGLWEALCQRLHRGDPRRALALAQVHSLRRSWGL